LVEHPKLIALINIATSENALMSKRYIPLKF
jgi:hypothetical protein